MGLLILVAGVFVIFIVVNNALAYNRLYCFDCDAKFDDDMPHKVELRTFEDHGGHDVHYYRALAEVYECPHCGKEVIREH